MSISSYSNHINLCTMHTPASAISDNIKSETFCAKAERVCVFCFFLGSWRLIPSPCALWAAHVGTAAPRWCPARLPRPTSHTWRRTPGSCGDASLTSGTNGDARKTNCSRWENREGEGVLGKFQWIYSCMPLLLLHFGYRMITSKYTNTQ